MPRRRGRPTVEPPNQSTRGGILSDEVEGHALTHKCLDGGAVYGHLPVTVINIILKYNYTQVSESFIKSDFVAVPLKIMILKYKVFQLIFIRNDK